MHVHIASVTPGLDEATRVASAGFVQPLTSALRDDVERHLEEGALVQSFTLEDVVVGFAIYRLFEIGTVRLLYLAGIILDPRIQGQHLAARAIGLAAAELGATHLGLRTQSLRMWLVGERLTCVTWAPHPSRELSDEDARLGAALSERIHGAGRFPQLAGFYGAPLYGEKPVYRDPLIQSWWDSICNFDAGDAVICLGTLPST